MKITEVKYNRATPQATENIDGLIKPCPIHNHDMGGLGEERVPTRCMKHLQSRRLLWWEYGVSERSGTKARAGKQLDSQSSRTYVRRPNQIPTVAVSRLAHSRSNFKCRRSNKQVTQAHTKLKTVMHFNVHLGEGGEGSASS